MGFSLKKVGESTADVHTASSATSSKLDAVKSLYGAQVARELLSISSENEQLKLKIEGKVSLALLSLLTNNRFPKRICFQCKLQQKEGSVRLLH